MSERELIQKVNELARAMPCLCAGDGCICQRCWMVQSIKKGLAKIDETEKLRKKKAWGMHGAAVLRKEARELTKHDAVTAARLRGRALELERR